MNEGDGKMAKAKYQFEDFLTTVPDECRDFVLDVHKAMLEENYKPKITVTKSTGLQLAYHQPVIKTVAGRILIFYLHHDKLMVRLDGKHHKQYSDVIDELPEELVSQIDKAEDCVKFVNPEKCWTGCKGYELDIRGDRYQKCIVQCFQFVVEGKNMPYLLKLIESESKARSLNGV